MSTSAIIRFGIHKIVTTFEMLSSIFASRIPEYAWSVVLKMWPLEQQHRAFLKAC